MPSPLENGPLPQRGLRRSDAAGVESGPCWIPVEELLTSRFLSRHTSSSSFDTLLGASGLSPERFSTLQVRADSTWEAFIRRVSSFSDWNAMLRDARGEWIMQRPGIAVDA